MKVNIPEDEKKCIIYGKWGWFLTFFYFIDWVVILFFIFFLLLLQLFRFCGCATLMRGFVGGPGRKEVARGWNMGQKRVE